MSNNGEGRFAHARQVMDEQFDALKSGVQHFADRVMTPREGGEPTRIQKLADQTATLIKEHPYVAIGVAFGLGYAMMRVMRR